MKEDTRGHSRAPLSCGCSGDGGPRCADGEALWQGIQAAGIRAVADSLRHAIDGPTASNISYGWSAYARAYQTYMAHLAANRLVEAPEPRGNHPQWEKPRVWRPEREGQA